MNYYNNNNRPQFQQQSLRPTSPVPVPTSILYAQQPSVPPRRKRSLSNSRFDQFPPEIHQPYFQDDYYFGSNQANLNRIRPLNHNNNFDQLPALYINNNLVPNNNNNNNPNYYHQQQPPPHPLQQLLIRPTSVGPNSYYQQQQQPPLELLTTTTTTIENQPSLLFAAMATPLSRSYSSSHVPSPYNNSSILSSSSSSSSSMYLNNYNNNNSNHYQQHQPKVRPHLDFLKSINIQYNPYQTKFNTTLMAKPSLDGYQSTQISPPVATAIAKGRDPMFSSKERLNQIQQQQQSQQQQFIDDHHHVRFATKSPPPARPPPPKFFPLSSSSSSSNRLSMENLPSNGIGGSGGYSPSSHDYAVIDHSTKTRDRRSLSPTRIGSPSTVGQRPYLSRATSPLPNLSHSPTSPTTRSPRAGSRTSSREPSPMRTFLNFSKNLLSPSKSPTTTPSMNRSAFSFDQSHSPSSSSMLNDTSQLSPLPSSSMYNSNTRLSSSSFNSNRTSSSLLLDGQMISGNDDYNNNGFTSKRINEQMRTMNPYQNQQQSLILNNPNDQQFSSQQFTDHYDQYKSLTSKILGKKTPVFTNADSNNINNNRLSGDFNDKGLDGWNSDGTNRSMTMTNNQKRSINEHQQQLQQQMAQQNGLNDPKMIKEIVQKFPIAQLHFSDVQPVVGMSTITTTTATATKFAKKLHQPEQQLRRNSSNSNLSAYQRKASLPAEYIAANTMKQNDKIPILGEQWNRENVAHLAHEARERKLRPPSKFKEKMKQMGVWFSKQFIFLLICALNILLAYMFYNLIAVLPKD